MNTDNLIRELAKEAPRAGPHAAVLRLAVGLSAGLAGAALFWFAIRGEAVVTAHEAAAASFLTKILYSAGVAVSAILVAFHLAAPDSRLARKHMLAFAPVAVMAMFAMTELMTSPPGDWMRLMFGYGVSNCVTMIMLISLPIFAGLFWSFRRFAPSYPKSAGAAIGGLAGASAAAFYALGSGEASTCFIFIWYTFAMAMTSLAGLVLGSRLLRW